MASLSARPTEIADCPTQLTTSVTLSTHSARCSITNLVGKRAPSEKNPEPQEPVAKRQRSTRSTKSVGKQHAITCDSLDIALENDDSEEEPAPAPGRTSQTKCKDKSGDEDESDANWAGGFHGSGGFVGSISRLHSSLSSISLITNCPFHFQFEFGKVIETHRSCWRDTDIEEPMAPRDGGRPIILTRLIDNALSWGFS